MIRLVSILSCLLDAMILVSFGLIGLPVRHASEKTPDVYETSLKEVTGGEKGAMSPVVDDDDGAVHGKVPPHLVENLKGNVDRIRHVVRFELTGGSDVKKEGAVSSREPLGEKRRFDGNDPDP
ncbi:MAG TPA: hypothetical protein PLR43_01550, partial [Syntrophales bacterium]|nr:hypothetical protein [Syntrophales bacterium]